MLTSSTSGCTKVAHLIRKSHFAASFVGGLYSFTVNIYIVIYILCANKQLLNKVNKEIININ